VSYRVVYLGNDAWSVPPMGAVASASGLDLALVMTRTPRPGRRGTGRSPTPVAVAAREMGLPMVEVETVRGGEGLRRLREAEPDVLAVVAYGEILTPSVLDVARMGAVNLHFSLLPRWRGASPVQHALLAGDRETGVTTMLLDEGLDTGPILAQEATTIDDVEDAGRLGLRLSEMGGALLARTLTDLAAGRASPTPQDDTATTHAPKLSAADRRIDWHAAPSAVLARIRAFAPQPGASTTRAGRVLKVLAASATGGEGEPGRIIAVGEGWFDVAADGGAVRVLEVASEGRSRMDAGSWMRGARPEIGERLG
jgi:methionyl-tRNA formyltransferase